MSQITRANAPPAFLPPKFNIWVLRLIPRVLHYWLKHKLKIIRINTVDIDRLVEVYKQSQMGRLRLVLAFRHPSNDDPFCLGYLLTKILPTAAKKHRIDIKSPVFAHFIDERGNSRWRGTILSWLYPKLGVISSHRGLGDARVDLSAERVEWKTARDLLVNGQMPLALAPEGASNGCSEMVNPLKSGAAQLGFWAMEDLVNAGRQEDVLILPIGIQYYYLDAPWENLENLMHQLELECGLTVDRQDSIASISQSDGRPMRKLLYNRLYKLCQHLLYQMENFYAQFYHYTIPERQSLDRAISRTEIDQRLHNILDFALEISETYFKLQPKGTKIDRCRRIEQAGWNWIYREELQPPERLPSVSQKLADRIATEADLRMWHMQIMESFIAVTGTYVKDKPTIDRFAEITLLLWDLISQIKGEKSHQRPILGKRRAQIAICNPIPISDYWDRYKSGRTQAKQAVTDLTQELQTAMEGTIERD